MNLNELRNKFTKSISLNQNLSKFTWFGVGGEAEILFIPEDIKELFELLKTKPVGYEVFPIGAGSNLLVRDKGIKDITLITKKLKKISIDDEGIITAQAGAIDADVARFARDHERTGLEFLIGIPGTIGGGIKMNSGAFGSEFKDVLIDVKAINTHGETRAFSCKELKMEYRAIGLDKKWIFYEARFHTLRESKEKIKTRMKEIIFLRKKAQPVGVKTGGSTFKNPPNAKAWELIDEAGCRGLQIGEAMISDKHSNFIINLGKCTSNQIEDLANTVKDRVFKKSGTCLSWEIQRVGIQ